MYNVQRICGLEAQPAMLVLTPKNIYSLSGFMWERDVEAHTAESPQEQRQGTQQGLKSISNVLSEVSLSWASSTIPSTDLDSQSWMGMGNKKDDKGERERERRGWGSGRGAYEFSHGSPLSDEEGASLFYPPPAFDYNSTAMLAWLEDIWTELLSSGA